MKFDDFCEEYDIGRIIKSYDSEYVTTEGGVRNCLKIKCNSWVKTSIFLWNYPTNNLETICHPTYI